MGKTKSSVRARRLGFRVLKITRKKSKSKATFGQSATPVAEGKHEKPGPVTFENTNSPGDAHVKSFWEVVKSARSPKLPGTGRDSFQEVERLMQDYGPKIWCRGDRRHLLKPGESTDYLRNLYWDEDEEFLRQEIAELYGSHGENRTRRERANAAQKRKRASYSEDFEDQEYSPSDSNSPSPGPSRVNEKITVHTDSPSDADDRPLYPLHRTSLWLGDSTETFRARLVLGTHITITDLFEAIKSEFINQNLRGKDEIEAKGEIEAIRLRYTYLGPGAEDEMPNPYTISLNDPKKKLTKFRDFLLRRFEAHRKPKLGDEILLCGTVLFINDKEADVEYV